MSAVPVSGGSAIDVLFHLGIMGEGYPFFWTLQLIHYAWFCSSFLMVMDIRRAEETFSTVMS